MKTFETDKTAKELGIDTTRKFVVVDRVSDKFDIGDIIRLSNDDNSHRLEFTRISDGLKLFTFWCHLAYADETPSFSKEGLKVGMKVKDSDGDLDEVVEVFENSFMIEGDLNPSALVYTYASVIEDGWTIMEEELKISKKMKAKIAQWFTDNDKTVSMTRREFVVSDLNNFLDSITED